MVHKAGIIRLYTSKRAKEGYTKEGGRPSEATLWNIFNNWPSLQKKSSAGLDNMASEGSDAFDDLISIWKSVKNEKLEKLIELMAGYR